MKGFDLLEDCLRDILEGMGLPLPSDLGPATVLGEDGVGLDSVGILQLLLAVEARAGIRLRDEGLTTEAILTLGGLADYVAAQQHG